MIIETHTLIPRLVLKAALTHAGTEDIRYYLNGIYVDLSSGHIVATDGHRMLVARLDDFQPGESYVIPRAACEAALKLAPKLRKAAVGTAVDVIRVIFTQDRSPDPERAGVTVVGKASLNVGGVTCEPVDGRFPEWRRVLPATVSGKSTILNPEYLLEAYKALALMAQGGLIGADVNYNGDRGPTVLTRKGVQACIAIMPMMGGPCADFDMHMSAILDTAAVHAAKLEAAKEGNQRKAA